MKLGLVVNQFATEKASYTTTRLGLAALRADHECWTMDVGSFWQDSDGRLRARAHRAPSKKYQSNKTFFEALQETSTQEIFVDELDILMLRNDPAEDMVDRPWAPASGIIWGSMAASHGVLVLNHPNTLARAINKLYFQHFPPEVRPKTLITREVEDVRRFYNENKGNIVIKPLQGSGGASVFLVGKNAEANLNQMVEAIVRDGYVVAQEYLPDAAGGDVRLFVMNGKPLEAEGEVAAFRRVNKTGDMRSNMHVGGQSEAAEVTDTMRRLAEIVRPKLVADGLHLVGLDIVGDKLMEINVFSPGGLGSAEQLTGVDFAAVVIADLERKLFYKERYDTRLDNQTLATL